MRRFIQPLIALVTLLSLLPVLWFGFTLSLGQHKLEQRVKVEGKEELQLVTTSVSYIQDDDFWKPIYLVVGIAVLLAVMYYVSVSRRKWIPALIGVVAALVFCGFGQQLRPKNGNPTFFMHGLGTIMVAAVALGLIWGALAFNRWFDNRS